jgi:polysaccharide pyruvyl transferase WcaK-like protein
MGGGNLGDDGTFDAVIRNIKNRRPEVEMIGLSMNPEDTRKRHGIPAFPIRHRTWGFGHAAASTRVTVKQRAKAVAIKHPLIYRLLQALNLAAIRLPARAFAEIRLLARAIPLLRSLDVLIISGGGQLIESSGGPWAFVGGPWQFPFTIFKWVLAAKLLRVECIVLNVGAGPLVRPLTKRLVRGALYLSDYVSFRDAESRALVQQIGVTRETHVICDSAYSLEIDAANAPLAPPARGRGIVGLAPMAFGDPRLSAKHDPAVYHAFIRQLAGFASWLLKNGYCVTLFCTDIGVDPPAIEDVERLLQDDYDIPTAVADGSLRRVHQWSTQELLLNMSSMDYAVVVRFHAVVFAHMLNIPILAINHHSKVRAQMMDLGLSEYCVNMENLDLGTLGGTFESLVTNRAEIKRGMSKKLAYYRAKLANQFDELFPGGPGRNNENVLCA